MSMEQTQKKLQIFKKKKVLERRLMSMVKVPNNCLNNRILKDTEKSKINLFNKVNNKNFRILLNNQFKITLLNLKKNNK